MSDEPKQMDPKEPLPQLEVQGSSRDVVEALSASAKRGKLPGYIPAKKGELFRLEAFAAPFESEVLAHADGEQDGRTRLRFELRMKPLMPMVFLVLLLVSVEPGQYFVDKLIPGSWGWWPTWWWYYPLAILGVVAWPFMVKKCARQARGEAQTMVEKVQQVLGAEAVANRE